MALVEDDIGAMQKEGISLDASSSLQEPQVLAKFMCKFMRNMAREGEPVGKN